MGISNLSGRHLKSVKQLAVSDHLLECSCSIDFDHFKYSSLWAQTNSGLLLRKVY